MNIKELLIHGKTKLNKENIEDGAIKSNLLLMYILNKSKEYFIIHENEEVDEKEVQQYKEYIEEIIKGKPIQYITNLQEFMGLKFYVDENVLIPQPDTEILVEEVIRLSKEFSSKIEILDMCTGSRCNCNFT